MVESGLRADVAAVAELGSRVRDNIATVIVGHESAIELLLVALLCEGHVLIEDVPGTGKTMLAKAAARSLDCSFRRIQCTPDLVPSDLTGLHFFDQRAQTFQFRPGPVFAQVLLADEINRATPRTQSALLEAMEERQVTLDGQTMPLERPFLVLATQNPIELEGTFPLPEAQLDRFMMRLHLGYPDEPDEETMLARFERDDPLQSLSPVAAAADILEAGARLPSVRVEPLVRRYLLTLVRSTRDHEGLLLGGSPRASLSLFRAARALAALRSRDYVLPDDVKELFVPVLAHRCALNPQARVRGRNTLDVLQEVLDATPVPPWAVTPVVSGEPWWGWAGAAMTVLGIAAGLPLLIALGVLLLVITIAARWWGRQSLRDVTYRRVFRERRAFPGEELSLQLTLENRKLLPLPWVEVRDNLPEGLAPEEGRATHRPRLTVVRRSAALAWRQRASWPLVLHCGQRGHYRIGPAEVRSADLFGLYEAVAQVPRPDSVIVYPHVADLPDLRWPAARPMGERQGRERIYEDPLRIAGLRDYEPGDSLRRVDWKATARRGELQSRVYEPSAGLTLLIAVDVATMPHLWEGYMPELLERTVSAAAGVATRADADGYSFGLVANASFPDSEHRVEIPPSRAPGQLMAVLEALAVLNPFVMEALEQMLASDARRLPYGATIAVVAATFRPALVEVLADLSARGRPVVFVLTGDEPPEDVPPRVEVVHAGPALAGVVAEFMAREAPR